MPHLRGQANWISFIWGDRRRRSAWCLQRCAQEVLEQAKGRGLCKYVNIFFWRLEIANGIELWVIFLLWVVEDCTFMWNWVRDRNTEEKSLRGIKVITIEFGVYVPTAFVGFEFVIKTVKYLTVFKISLLIGINFELSTVLGLHTAYQNCLLPVHCNIWYWTNT